MLEKLKTTEERMQKKTAADTIVLQLFFLFREYYFPDFNPALLLQLPEVFVKMFFIGGFNPTGISGDDITGMECRNLFANTQIIVRHN